MVGLSVSLLSIPVTDDLLVLVTVAKVAVTSRPGGDASDKIDGLLVCDGLGVIGLFSEPRDVWFSEAVVGFVVVGKFGIAS